MKICSNNHKEVSFSNEECPVCELIKKKKFIPVEYILKDIENELKNIENWYKLRIAENVFRAERDAETLLYLIEAIFVGRRGGYDVGQRDRTLKGRYEWLCKKMDTL